jgi:UDP-2,4-diacetamido-2,4,6-trideoxy-beta-L-altropyranose hydrolase
MGAGHLSRCLALADGFREAGHESIFICREFRDSAIRWLTDRGHPYKLLPGTSASAEDWLGCSEEEDSAETLQALRTLGEIDWVVVDHYSLGKSWESRVAASVSGILAIDDLANRAHDVSWIVDQNFYPNGGTRYDSLLPERSRKLLGPKYALLRKEFSELHKEEHGRGGPVKNIGVFMGGGDPSGCTKKIVSSLLGSEFSGIKKHVVVGPSNPLRGELGIFSADLPDDFIFYDHVPNMAKFLASVDLMVGAGGVSSWERCCLGVPALVLLVAGNQADLTFNLASYGAVRTLGFANKVSEYDIACAVRDLIESPDARLQMSSLGKRLVDGLGVQRVVGEVCLNMQ